ncbi:MAG: DUF423 domain-containing protein [Gammaproteobacteria bacterium]
MNPSMVAPWFVALGAIAAFIGVGAGAFGAHALRDALAPDLMRSYLTAVQYQLIHALGLVAVGVSERVFGGSALIKLSGLMMLLGLVLFCGSLYVLALTGLRRIGLITPVGGIAFLVGWLCLAVGIVWGSRTRD